MIVVPESNLIYPAYIVHYESLPNLPQKFLTDDVSVDNLSVQRRISIAYQYGVNWNQTLERGVITNFKLGCLDPQNQADIDFCENYVKDTLFPVWYVGTQLGDNNINIP